MDTDAEILTALESLSEKALTSDNPLEAKLTGFLWDCVSNNILRHYIAIKFNKALGKEICPDCGSSNIEGPDPGDSTYDCLDCGCFWPV